ncbi:radical SAM protein [bacterium]|nr:radical SAM protein [bacterium]
MRVHLINPPELPGYISDRDKAGGLGTMFPINRRYRYRAFTPPLDMMYAAAVAEREGHEVRVIDACAERLKRTDLLIALEKEAPDAVGVRLSLPTLKEDLSIAKVIKTVLPRVKVFVFGNVIQTTHTRWLDACGLDGALFGEPEALVADFLAGKHHAQVWTPKVPFAPGGWLLQDVAQLDALPFPAWHLLDMRRYSPDGTAAGATYYVLTSRGCPKACSMCPYYVHQGGPWRARSLESVKAELDHLKALGARFLQARDPNIGLVKKRLRAIAEAMTQGAYGFKWVIETDLESLDPETLDVLAKGGLTRLMTGIESADPAILREIRQHPDALKLTLKNIARCKELGIELTGFMVVGSTSESFESVVATVRMAQALPMNYSVSLMTPYLGTVYRKEAEELGHVTETGNYHELGGTACVVRTRHLDKAKVKLAYRWAQGELEWTRRQRALREASPLVKPFAALRLAKHAVWHAPTNWHFGLEREAARKRESANQNLAGVG